ncbi:MAG: Hg(II)-responsive transcriptional regulator [Acidiferrobacter sp.]
MAKAKAEFTIGTLAAAAGVHVETIRFYQREGLLLQPPRPYGSIRHYGATEVERVRFIKASQRLGFSLEEVRELLKLEDGAHCDEARLLAEQRLQDVRGRLADLYRIEVVLGELVQRCGAARGAVKCPLIHALRGS